MAPSPSKRSFSQPKFYFSEIVRSAMKSIYNNFTAGACRNARALRKISLFSHGQQGDV